jgi:hypothetical protein
LKPALRNVVAFTVAPVSFGIGLFVLSLITSSPLLGSWAFGMTALVGYPVAILIGLPTFILLNSRGLGGLGIYSVVAAVLSAVMISCFVVGPIMSEGTGLAQLGLPARLGQMTIITFACFLTVLVFWLIARPDRQLAKPGQSVERE